jgi:hypothetical protein
MINYFKSPMIKLRHTNRFSFLIIISACIVFPIGCCKVETEITYDPVAMKEVSFKFSSINTEAVRGRIYFWSYDKKKYALGNENASGDIFSMNNEYSATVPVLTQVYYNFDFLPTDSTAPGTQGYLLILTKDRKLIDSVQTTNGKASGNFILKD